MSSNWQCWKGQVGFYKRQIWPKGNTFYCSEINWGNSLQIKNPLKGCIIFGRKKKSSLRKTAGNRKLWGFHPAGFDPTASPYHEKAEDWLQLCLLSTGGGKRLCGLWATPSRRRPPSCTDTNNDVEKETWSQISSNSKIAFYRFYDNRRIFVET